MRKIVHPLLLFGMLVVLHATAAGPTFAASPFSSSEELSRSQFGITFGYMTGMTLYHISSYDVTGTGVESELEFPLKTALFGLEGSYRSEGSGTRGGFQFDYRWLSNLGNGSGKMKDSDWLTDDVDIALVGAAHPGLDIYSESDIALKATIIDLRLVFEAWSDEQWRVGPLMGIIYERFSYDVSNVNQVGFGPYAPTDTGSVAGLVLDYEVTYTLPVLGLRTELLTGDSFEALLDLGYAPWATAKDRDDHLLRSKLSEASTKGNAVLATITAGWDMGANNRLALRGEYLKIRTTGTQNQVFYDGSGVGFAGINDRIDSQQATISMILTTRW